MPARVGIKETPSTVVQGSDSWVKVSRPTVDEIQALMDELPRPSEGSEIDPTFVKANIEVSKRLIATHVLGWNWVDDDGNPLPQPKDDPTVVGRLTDQEMKFLSELLTINDKDAKKKN